jgi:hypothetical protein
MNKRKKVALRKRRIKQKKLKQVQRAKAQAGTRASS